jgi:hypothetical protein
VQVIDMLTRGVMINVAGLGATLLGIQTMVGMLVAKTLSNARWAPRSPPSWQACGQHERGGARAALAPAPWACARRSASQLSARRVR